MHIRVAFLTLVVPLLMAPPPDPCGACDVAIIDAEWSNTERVVATLENYRVVDGIRVQLVSGRRVVDEAVVNIPIDDIARVGLDARGYGNVAVFVPSTGQTFEPTNRR